VAVRPEGCERTVVQMVFTTRERSKDENIGRGNYVASRFIGSQELLWQTAEAISATNKENRQQSNQSIELYGEETKRMFMG